MTYLYHHDSDSESDENDVIGTQWRVDGVIATLLNEVIYYNKSY